MRTFHQQLQNIRLFIRCGRLAGLLLALVALAAAVWIVFGIADSFAAFESTARVAITTALVVICALAAIVGLWLALRVPPATAATIADQALGDPRKPVSAGLTMRKETENSPLGAFLSKRALESSGETLGNLKRSALVPWRLLTIPAIAILVLLAVTAALKITAPGPFATIAARLLHPASDLPPYSPLSFVIDPARPTTVYGGEILITAVITGGVPEQAVECLVRRRSGGDILRLPAFRESSGRFSRKLDGLTEDVEIAFATGKARSTWHTVELLREPNILSGVVRITPPGYSGMSPAEFQLDTNEIAALEGSTVTLELASNRPLGSASLLFMPTGVAAQETAEKPLDGEIKGGSTAAFTWTATRSGKISASLKDVRGTPTPKPMEIAFKALPDLPPTVLVNSPPPMMLATPRSKIPVIGQAQDDYALAKVRFVRTLSGFRDRAHLVAPALNGRSFDFNDKLDLEDIGLDAGQTIELMLEATDHNPSLLGQGSSEISRIRIISENQYAEYIRAKTTLEQFAARFRAAAEAIEQAREALEKLKEAAETGDKEAIEKAAEAARKAHEQSAGLMDKIAGDFPAFELEKRLKELAEKQAGDLRENADGLKNLDPAAPKEELQQKADEMLERLGRRKQEAEQLDDDLDKVNHAAKLLEMAARFRKIYEDQVSVTKRFGGVVEELRRGEDRNRRQLPLLAETQDKNRKALDEFKTELRKRLEELPDDDENLMPLIDSALKFLDELETAAPETLMDAATASGKAGQAADAFSNAEKARALLERLMSEPEPFPQAAKGKAPEFDIERPDVNENLRQLLEGLMAQNPGQGDGNQPGQGGGMGAGGFGMGNQGGPGGFPMDLPVTGPDRLSFDSSSESGRGGNDGGKSRPPVPLPENAESGTLRPDATRKGDAPSIDPESIPENYRDAVKKYLTP